MDKLPIISGQDLIKLLLKLDYQVHHQTGSHIILRQNKVPFRRLTIPNHKEISRGTLRAIIRQAGLTRETFLKLL
jgi:predicted RNA binding protein YcfA (HicA-like mRNA interferase family)